MTSLILNFYNLLIFRSSRAKKGLQIQKFGQILLIQKFLSLLPKFFFLLDIALQNQLSMIFKIFLHVFTFLKLVNRKLEEIFFGKSDFFLKFPIFAV